MGSWQYLNQKEGNRISLLQDVGHVRWFLEEFMILEFKKVELFSCRILCPPSMVAYKLMLIWHGESAWNLENRFSGWYDTDLSPAGHEEAKHSRQALQDAGYEFDICFTSVQKRAIRTIWIILDAIDQMWLPVVRTWCLNERYYGDLTGLNKAETDAKHGEAQVKIWRQSYDVPLLPIIPSTATSARISGTQTLQRTSYPPVRA